MSIVTQILSGAAWVLYGSFFEWYWHKYWMHQPRTPKEAFRGHTIVHHGLYKGDDRYFVARGEHPEHILLKPYALPAIILAHLPVVLLIDRWLIPHTAVGAMVACVGYFATYEYMHYNMHVPRDRFVERFRWFQYLRKHHHLHHRYFQFNYCVLLPLADLCMGTLATEESLARRKAERERTLASGKALAGTNLGNNRVRRGEPGRGLLQGVSERLKRISPAQRRFACQATRRFRENYRTGRPRAAGPPLGSIKEQRGNVDRRVQ